MLKKMRWRFIRAAMAATAAVIVALLCAINLWSYRMTTRMQDGMLRQLLEQEQEGMPPFEEGSFRPDGQVGRFSQEMRYMTRFFTVRCNGAGSALEVGHDYIASVTGEEAAAYAEEILQNGRSSGYSHSYRYLVSEEEDGFLVIFLNAERELQSQLALLLVSSIVALVAALAIFVLILLFSRRAVEPYARNIETQKRFITDASHELKTPLTAISASADVLALDGPDNEWVRNIQQQSARLSRLIADLVTLSRLDEGQPYPEAADFSLSDAVWELSEPMAALAKARGKSYSAEIEDDITLHGDRAAVQQLISILLDNAVKYSDEGGEIRLTVRRQQKKAVISVYNTCAQLDVQSIDRLFDRFYRPDDSRSKASGGTGLGLSIARATAEAHGGTICAASKTGRDITFTVRLNEKNGKAW